MSKFFFFLLLLSQQLRLTFTQHGKLQGTDLTHSIYTYFDTNALI